MQKNKNKRGFIIVLLKPKIDVMLAAVCPPFIFSLVKVKACRIVITVSLL